MFNRQKVRVAPALLIIALALLATLAPAKPAWALGAPVLSKSGGVYSSYSQWTWNESVSWTSVPGAQSYNCKLGYPTGHVETISYCTPALVTAADGLISWMRVQAVDANDVPGNWSNVIFDIKIDRQAPPKPSLSLNGNSSVSWPFQIDTERLERYECRAGNGAWTQCSSPQTLPYTMGAYQIFSVRAIDDAQNQRSASVSYCRPDPLIYNPCPSGGSNQ